MHWHGTQEESAAEAWRRKVETIIVLLVASSTAATSQSFAFAFELRRYPPSHINTPMMRATSAQVSAALQFSRTGNAANVLEAGLCAPVSYGDKEMVENYEYLHPDISSILLTKASQNESEGNISFVVDSGALTLRRAFTRQDDPDLEHSTADTLPMNLLARLAEECDCVVFDEKIMHTRNIPKKIFGLIGLSQCPSPLLPRKNDQMNAEKNREESNEFQNSALLVATTIALNLLESSIRAIVLESCGQNRKSVDLRSNGKRSAGRDSADFDPQSQRGSPLLKDMIHEMSNLDHCLDPKSLPTNLSQAGITLASDIAPVLRALLLPTRVGGLNLRNLASHGFLSTIDRRWFSLTLVLIQTLDSLLISNTNLKGSANTKGVLDNTVEARVEEAHTAFDANRIDYDHGTSSLTQYEPMAWEVQYGRRILLNLHSGPLIEELERQTGQFVPSSHMHILRFGLHVLAPTLQQCILPEDQIEESLAKTTVTARENNESMPALTAIFTTLLCSLLEHSLRLLWCKVNNRPGDCMARPSEYYVTLDGHGQRDRHDVIINPFLCDGMTRNQMIPVIGANACALLSDLFLAPSVEAPNIRSAVCHGSWDGELVKELEGLAATAENSNGLSGKSSPLLLDTACALMSCLDLILSNLSETKSLCRRPAYRPVYTYTSTAVRNLNDIFRSLAELDLLISNDTSIAKCMATMEQQHPKLCNNVRQLNIELELIVEMAHGLFPTMKINHDEVWTTKDTYSEHRTNIALARNIAALTLLSDASNATKNYLREVQERIDKLSMIPSSTKDRRLLKTTARFCSAAMVAREFYTFTVYVAVLAIQHDSQSVGLYRYDEQNTFNRNDIVRVVERSRMTLSTFESHIRTNLDRSLKALQTYLQGKALKFFRKIKSDP